MAMYEPQVTTAPSTEPVSVAEVKVQLRLDDPTDAVELANMNTQLAMFIGAARQYYEWRTGHTVHQTAYRYVLDEFPASLDYVVLPRAVPLIAITQVVYLNSSGTSTTWSSSEYIADTFSLPGRLVLAYNYFWPSFTAYPVAPIRIDYTAGIATTSPITEADDDIKLPILLLVGGMWENRESEVIQSNLSSAVRTLALQYGVEAFIARRTKTYVF